MPKCDTFGKLTDGLTRRLVFPSLLLPFLCCVDDGFHEQALRDPIVLDISCSPPPPPHTYTQNLFMLTNSGHCDASVPVSPLALIHTSQGPVIHTANSPGGIKHSQPTSASDPTTQSGSRLLHSRPCKWAQRPLRRFRSNCMTMTPRLRANSSAHAVWRSACLRDSVVPPTASAWQATHKLSMMVVSPF
jgi:hypothetical protein